MVGRSEVAIILALGLIALAQANPSGRILGGADAGITQFPYVSSVRVDNAHICGGTLVSKQHIVTAAHCVYENSKRVSADRVSVRLGSTNQFSGGVIYVVDSITVHPDFVKFENDIAVLRLTKEVTPTARIESIELAASAADMPAADAQVTVAGWGEQASGSAPYKLQFAEMPVASESACLNAYSEHNDSTFCVAHALKQGNCYGDAGNGAVYNNKLVGISAFIVGACGSRYPDVYTSVLHYNQWIHSVIDA